MDQPIDRLRAEMKKLEGTWHIGRSDPDLQPPKTSWLEEWICVVLYAAMMFSLVAVGWVCDVICKVKNWKRSEVGEDTGLNPAAPKGVEGSSPSASA